jgi:hypothetical protein
MWPGNPATFFFAEDPAWPAGLARIFWPSSIDLAVIPASALPVAKSHPDAFDVYDLAVPASILTCPGAPEELALGVPGRSIRLSIRTGTVLSGPVRLTYELSGFSRLDTRLAALQRLVTFRQGKMKSIAEPKNPTARRRLLLLRTLDALALNPSLRAVAVAMYGQERVQQDWNSHSDFLKSRVRRLVAHARHLTGSSVLQALSDVAAI